MDSDLQDRKGADPDYQMVGSFHFQTAPRMAPQATRGRERKNPPQPFEGNGDTTADSMGEEELAAASSSQSSISNSTISNDELTPHATRYKTKQM